jgi:tetratricopeptide (TPR) repeat protein
LTTGWKLYRDNQDYEGALILLDRAVETNQPQARYWKSQVLAAVGRWDEAIEALEQQIQADPKYQVAYNALAQMYLDRDQADKTVDVQQRWLTLNPNDRAMRGALVRAYLAGGKAVEAEEAATNLTLPAPLDRPLNIDRATARVCQGKAGKAELETAWVRPAPNDMEGIARFLLACNADPALIRDLLSQGIELMRPFVDIRTNDLRSVFAAQFAHARLLTQRGRLSLRSGKTAEGIADLRAALNMLQDPRCMALLAPVLWEAGNRAEAAQLWADAIATGVVAAESIPQEARPLLPAAKLTERDWFEAGRLLLNPLPPGDLEPRYYYVRAKEDGSVDRVRDLSPEPSPEDALAEVRRLVFPQLVVDGKQLPSAHIVRLMVDPSGAATLFRSNTQSTFLRMSTLTPANFPVQPAAAAAGEATRAAERSASQQ